jgi:hypothetical protein
VFIVTVAGRNAFTGKHGGAWEINIPQRNPRGYKDSGKNLRRFAPRAHGAGRNCTGTGQQEDPSAYAGIRRTSAFRIKKA